MAKIQLEYPKLGSTIVFLNGRTYEVKGVKGSNLMYQTPFGSRYVGKTNFIKSGENTFKYVNKPSIRISLVCDVPVNAIRNYSGRISAEFNTAKDPMQAAKGYIVSGIKKYNNSFDIKLLNWLVSKGILEIKVTTEQEKV